MNTKLSRTIMSATLLVGALALAGCGGGDDTPAEESGMSAEDKVAAAEAAQAQAEADKKEAEDKLAAKEKEEAEAKAAADAAAMVATAKKLHTGISAQMGSVGSPTAGDRIAGYDSNETGIDVSISAGAEIELSEDKKTMVAALSGWEGKRYADPAGGDMVEAMVYSNVEAPTMGRKFGKAGTEVSAEEDDRVYEYSLTDGGVLENADIMDPNVVLTGVTRTAGVETFELPESNPDDGATLINVAGSYHGVSGTYTCDTTAGDCTATVAAKGFDLTDNWTFKPSNAEARVMESEDSNYVSYGWWIHKSADDATYIASAFVDEKGDVDEGNVNLADLKGTAKYSGGAAGKYALYSTTGGTNDAGHFTAAVTLEADFTNKTEATAISGTINNFIGADGENRPSWSVKLNSSPINSGGGIGQEMGGTTWTIDETAADKAGQWSGNLQNIGEDKVPQVATGTFYSEYGSAGKMVGAFGANKE